MESTKRRQTIAADFGLFLALFGLVMTVNPFIPGLDLEELGFALAFFGITILVAGVATWVIYFGRSRALEKLMRDEGELVHWRYDPAFWQAYTQAEFEVETSAKNGLFMAGSAIALVVGVVFFVADHEAGAYVFLVMVGLMVMMGVLAYVVPRLNRSTHKSHAGEAVITPNTLYIGGRLHLFNKQGCRLVAVNLITGSPEVIELGYHAALVSTVPQIEVVRVPVPPGQEAEARKVIDCLQSQL